MVVHMPQIKHLEVQSKRKELLAQLSLLESSYLSIGKAIRLEAIDPKNEAFYENLLTCEMLLCVNIMMIKMELKELK